MLRLPMSLPETDCIASKAMGSESGGRVVAAPEACSWPLGTFSHLRHDARRPLSRMGEWSCETYIRMSVFTYIRVWNLEMLKWPIVLRLERREDSFSGGCYVTQYGLLRMEGLFR